MNNFTDCQNNREAITALVLDELEPVAADELHQHIGTCRKCRKLYEALADEEQMLRSTFDEVAATIEKAEDSLVGQLSEHLYKSMGPGNPSILGQSRSFGLSKSVRVCE